MIRQAASDLSTTFRRPDSISSPMDKSARRHGDEGKQILAVSELDMQPKDTKVGRIRVAAGIMLRLFSFLFQAPSLLNKSQKYWAYKPLYFRLIVSPFKNEDVLPTQQIPFENCLINVPNNYQNVLGLQFGDYSRTPAIHDRIALPFFTENDRYHQ